MKTVLLVVNSEKSDLVVTENVHSIEETIIPVVEMTKNEVIGFVHLAETIILLSELNAIVAENQSEVTFRNVAAPSETTVADVETIVADAETTVADAETTVVEEDAMIADLVTKNNIIEMTGFVLHVRMTTSLSELNATNVESLDQEETLEEEIHVEATEEVATAADAMVTVADVEATEEVASVADAMETVADVEATEEVAPVADAMESVADVEMTVQTNSIERPVENDLAMLTIDHLRKSSHVDINDAMTMTTKVNI